MFASSPLRATVLTVGPVVLVVACYKASITGAPQPRVFAGGNAAENRAARAGGVSSPPSPRPTPSDAGARRPRHVNLDDGPQSGQFTRPPHVDCRAAADDLLSRLADAEAGRPPHTSLRLHVVIRPPYVLVGDLPEAKIEGCYRDVVVPVARCLSIDYFDRQPDAPIVILMLSGAEGYHRSAGRLDGRSGVRWYGYYVRAERRIVVNVATGTGTLAHELTHALAHFDCPGLPVWFDEGLAALHEESRFSDDGLHLVGLSNWRLNVLQDALRRGALRPIASLLADGIQPETEPLDYAHARYLCLYLQQKGLLTAFYRKLKAEIHRDPDGLATLCALPGIGPVERLEGDFRQWLGGRR